MRPRHIHFEIASETTEGTESCDFRFYSVKPAVSDNTQERRRLKTTEVAPPTTTVATGTSSNSTSVAATTDDQSKTAIASDAETNASGEGTDEEEKKDHTVTRAPAGPNSLYTSVEFSDVAFFRFGYFDYAKLNTASMLSTYEASTWYAIDLLLNWQEQRVSIYMNGEEFKSASFFTQRQEKLQSANAISIYGLSPGSISKFRNIRVCNQVCAPEAAMNLKDLSRGLLGFGSALISLAVLSLAFVI